MIGIDVDGRDRGDASYRMLKAYYNLRWLFPRAHVVVEITKHGYHLCGFGPCLTFETECTVRAALGDDRTRVKLDEYKKSIGSHNFNVLWTEKRGFNVYEIEPV